MSKINMDEFGEL